MTAHDEGTGETDRLVALAARVADGDGVDWTAAQQRASGDAERRLLRALQTLAEVTAVFKRAAREPISGSRWGPLVLREVLASGGFGAVYRAYDERLEREVALKLLDREAPGPQPPGSGERAIEEARLLAKVRHPNVVVVHGADEREGRIGIWMELIEGETLADRLEQGGPFPAREAARIGIDVSRALAAVHGAGLLHRDVKAQNVMRERGGRIVLMDFGLGVPRDGAPPSLAGTLPYLAPETILAQGPPTVATDVYAVGVLLFHLVTGRFPVEAHGLDEARAAFRRGRMLRAPELRSDVPRALVAVLDRALALEPLARFRSAGEMEDALGRVVTGFSRPSTSPATPGRPGGQASLLAALAGLASLLVVWTASRPPHPASSQQPTSAAPSPKSSVTSPRVSVAEPDRPSSARLPSSAETGDPFVRPVLSAPGIVADGAAEAGAYVVEATVTARKGTSGVPSDTVAITLKASTTFWLFVVREDARGAWLAYPLPSQQASNPLDTNRPHRLPPFLLRLREPRETLLLIGSPAPLLDFEAALAKWRVPESASGVPLSGAPLEALRRALGQPYLQGGPARLFAKADRLTGHPEMVRGVWVRRVED